MVKGLAIITLFLAFLVGKGELCFLVYSPVCGVDGKTYANSCVANVAKVPIRHSGGCDGIWAIFPNGKTIKNPSNDGSKPRPIFVPAPWLYTI